MVQFHIALVAIGLFLTVGQSIAQNQAPERNFGLGIIVGEPTGLSAKYWTSPTTAFDFALGWGFIDDNNHNNGNGNGDGDDWIHFHMDYLWHAFDAISSTERFPIYYGIGGRVNAREGDNSSFAIRGVIGIAWMPHDAPFDLFLELAPSLRLTQSTGFAIDGGFGGRYYF